MAAMPLVNVLLVEDDAAMRGILRALFEREGYAVTDAATIEAAQDALASDRVDIVILDLVLGPQQSGLDVLRAIRAQAATARLPVIILTGKLLSDVEQEQIREGKAYVFYKPPDLANLGKYVARLMKPQRT